MIVFYGRYYWGKRDEVFDRARCGICGREHRPVRSYSAWVVWHYMFVPLIPFGRMRVVRHCLTCKRLYQFSLGGPKLKAAVAEERLRAFKHVGQDINQSLEDVASLAHLGDFEGVGFLVKKLEDLADVAGLLGRARFSSLVGKADEAELNFQRAVATDRLSGTASFWQGHFFLMQQRDEEAVAALRRAAELDPACDYFELLENFSMARKQQKNWHGLATIMLAMMNSRPEMATNRQFIRLYAKACNKSGRTIETVGPYPRT